MPYIYVITNDINNKQYVGKTQYDDIQIRWKDHLNDFKKPFKENRPLYRAMNKYGISHFSIKPLEYVKPTDNLEEREQYWIKELNTYHNGYNATKGGDGKASLDYEKLIEAYQELKSLTEVSKKYHCDIGHLSKILKSYNITIETSQEINLKKHGTPIEQYDKNNNYIKTFPSAWEALFEVSPKTKSGGGVSHITDVCKGKRKTAYGYIWRYANVDK